MSARVVAVDGPRRPVRLAMKRNPPGPLLTSVPHALSFPRTNHLMLLPSSRPLSIHIPPIPISIPIRILHPSTIVQSSVALLYPPFISLSLALAAFLVQVFSSVSEATAARAKPQTTERELTKDYR
jgi:hypothetical protein